MKEKEFGQTYIKNIFRIIFVASILISLSVMLTASLGYIHTRSSLINKAKSQDLVFMVKSMASKIDGRISRAVETSYVFARDPLNMQWVRDGEKNAELGKTVLGKLESTVASYDYNYAFVAGVKSENYYFRENSRQNKSGKNFMVLSKSNAEDSWFYEMLKAKKEMTLNVNYDTVMGDYFLFVNTIMGSVDNPVGITGVGLNLNSVTKEFKEFKIGNKSDLWVVDEKGTIKLSDKKEAVGKKLKEYLPGAALKQLENRSNDKEEEVKVYQYYDENNEVIDYAYCKLNLNDWILFYRIPRKESLTLLASLKLNTILTVALVLSFFIILFYFISKKIANPYQQAMLLNMELEEKVDTRTQELQESNEKIKDSIEYAKRLQESILPLEKDIKRVFKDSFIIWRPRDIVGGDFFWLREMKDGVVAVVGDCTGHGVPGALMTMTVNAILHNIVTTIGNEDPSEILRELHKQLKETLNKGSNPQSVDDGLDIAIFYINKNKNLLYAGAGMELYMKRGNEVKIFKPQSKGAGYSYIDLKDILYSENIFTEAGDLFVVSTDGFIHQNGGQKNYPLGKKRLLNMIEKSEAVDLTSMKVEFEAGLEEYMGVEEQRDDITVFAFKLK